MKRPSRVSTARLIQRRDAWMKKLAALGPMTSLGASGNPGTLAAANGLVLANGDHVLGFGVIDTPDDPEKPLINDGSILGNSAGERIELSGYVKGLGTLDHVTITGTDAPGLSTAAVNRGSVNSGPTKLAWSGNARRWMPNTPRTA